MEELKKYINSITQEEMAELWRFAPVGHYLFEGEAGQYFAKVFQEKGGMTPKISKKLGWWRIPND